MAVNNPLPQIDEGRMTADQFIAKYGDFGGVELIDGRVVWAGQDGRASGEAAMPKFRHGVYCNTAARLLDEFVRPRSLGWVAVNDTFVQTANDTYRGADVLYVSFAKVPNGEPPEDLTVPPDLVIEVRSPSDRISALTEKAGEYLRSGVAVVIILDPNTRSAAVFRNEDWPTRLHNGDELTLPDVLPGFAVPVKRFFE